MEKRNFKENNAAALKIGQKEFSLESQNIFEIKIESLLLLSNLVRKDYFCRSRSHQR